MAQLANCPQCDHDLLVPDGVAAGSWVRCPSCQAFFQLQEALARELPTVEVLTAASDPNSESEVDHSRPTVAGLSAATLAETGLGDATEEIEERATLNINDRADAAPKVADEFGFGELGAMFDSNEVADEDQPHSRADETIDVDYDDDSTVPQLHVADVEDSDSIDVESLAAAEPSDDASPEVKSPEAAAERIDAWFRSAKTLADIPAVQNPDVDYRADRESLFGPLPPAANNATIEIGSGGIEATSDDFELDAPEESSQEVAAWDDSQHMDQLLAQIDQQPQDEYTPEATDDVDDSASMHGWAADAANLLASQKEKPGKKRSLARMMVATVIGGFMAVPLAGYALMWIGGPEGDFLGAAKYLPQSMLPASFKTKPQHATAALPPAVKTTDDATINDSTETAAAPTPATDRTANTTDSTEGGSKVTETPAEKLATFNEPLEAKKPAEPAPFDAPPAAPLKYSADIGEPIQITGAPSFAASDLAAALEAGRNAEQGLVTGSFGDSNEINKAKGSSYKDLADLAQKATFVDGAAGGEAKKLRLEADDLFRKILSDEHARNEIGQIVLKWIAAPNRKHGGVFFAGSVQSCEARGPVSECSITLPGGQTLPVLIPTAVAEQAKPSQQPVAIVGWIVDEPSKHVTGYTGSASQAIFAPRLISLE